MPSPNVNPFEPSVPSATLIDNPSGLKRWPVIVAMLTCGYFLASALTLPFADDVWFGEVPLLAFIQMPKGFVKSIVQSALMSLVSASGLSSGSHSPDYIATHFWAMGVMTTVPALTLAGSLLRLQRVPRRRWLVGAVLLSASLDAIVTFWFEQSSRLSLYNSAYF